MIVFSMESLFIMYKVNTNDCDWFCGQWSHLRIKKKMHQSLKSIIKYMFRC